MRQAAAGVVRSIDEHAQLVLKTAVLRAAALLAKELRGEFGAFTKPKAHRLEVETSASLTYFRRGKINIFAEWLQTLPSIRVTVTLPGGEEFDEEQSFHTSEQPAVVARQLVGAVVDDLRAFLEEHYK